MPRQLEDMPISITTTCRGPYDDQLPDEGLLVYHIQEQTTSDLNNRDDDALRLAMERRLRLVCFSAVSVGWYVPVFPVFMALEDRAAPSFHIPVNRAYGLGEYGAGIDQTDDPVDSPLSIKRYIHSMVRSRPHLRPFRLGLLTAFSSLLRRSSRT